MFGKTLPEGIVLFGWECWRKPKHEAQPQLTKPVDLERGKKELRKPLDLSMMKTNEEQTEVLDLSVMETNQEQTEALDLSIPKVDIKKAADRCNISIQDEENESIKLSGVMNDEQNEPSNLPISEADEEGKKKKKERKINVMYAEKK
ncbi:hypothetical protein DINM_003014 [Dirofilaria immitis]|nr:hypothetical protein [Dirofilaria immitis]